MPIPKDNPAELEARLVDLAYDVGILRDHLRLVFGLVADPALKMGLGIGVRVCETALEKAYA